MRRLSLLVILIAATSLFAQGRVRASAPVTLRPEISGDTVTGTVSSVSGTLIRLADGLVTIDISHAKVSGEIAPGALLIAMLQPGTIAANAPLPAAFVGVTKLPQVTLSGTVSAVDQTNGTLTLLGRTIQTNSSTRFSGLLTFKTMTLADVMPGQFVIVEASASSGALIASSVNVASLHAQPSLTVIHGTVKSIGTDAWVITSNGKDITVPVNDNTKILGSPKVSDPVDVFVGDSAASMILKDLPAVDQIHLNVFVKSIDPAYWSVGGPPGSLSPDYLIVVNADTQITGNPQVGDLVEIVAHVPASGPPTAISITKK